MRIYLAGPINGKTDEECHGWRRRFKGIGHHYWLDPMDRDYRGKEAESVPDIVEGDKKDIHGCNMMIVYAETPSWGTAMEVIYAQIIGKKILVICSNPRPSPWLIYHATTIFTSVDDALSFARPDSSSITYSLISSICPTMTSFPSCESLYAIGWLSPLNVIKIYFMSNSICISFLLSIQDVFSVAIAKL